VDDPLRLRLHTGVLVGGQGKARLGMALHFNASCLMRTFTEACNEKTVLRHGRRERVLFYEVVPYNLMELNHGMVLEFTMNNATLTSKIQPSITTESASPKRNFADDGTIDEVITIRETPSGKRSRLLINTISGIVTISILALGSWPLEQALDVVKELYPELGPDLSVFEVSSYLRVRRMNDPTNLCFNLAKSSLSNSHSYSNNIYTLLDDVEIVETEKQLLQIVFFVKDRNSSYTDVVILQGLPHLTYMCPGERLSDIITRVQPSITPQLVDLTPAYISPTNVAFAFEEGYEERDITHLMMSCNQNDAIEEFPALGFECAPSFGQVKRHRREEGIRIDC